MDAGQRRRNATGDEERGDPALRTLRIHSNGSHGRVRGRPAAVDADVESFCLTVSRQVKEYSYDLVERLVRR